MRRFRTGIPRKVGRMMRGLHWTDVADATAQAIGQSGCGCA
jgi:hypothetical protein